MSSIDDILTQVKPATASVRVCLDGDLLGDLDLINEDLAQYDGWESDSLSDVDPRAKLKARKAELEALIRAKSATFRFHNIGDKPWSDLHAAHPPTEGKEDSEDFDPATFPTALIAAAAVDPVMTLEQAGALMDKFTLTQRNMLFGTAYRANIRGVDVPFLQEPSAAPQPTAKKSK
jgi:hypothetical protein